MSDLITVEEPRPGVAVITMTNPAINNNGSWVAIGEVAAQLRAARERGIRAAVLASGVEGHWFEHAWLQDLADGVEGKPTTAHGSAWYSALQELADPGMVTIAAITGDCSGGGAELGWACDLRIAEEHALFAQPEVGMALTTGIGGTSRLARLIGRTAAAEMVLLGFPMTAQRIYDLGGLNRVVARGMARRTAVEWGARIAARPPQAVAALKRILRANDDLSLTEALLNEQKEFGGVARTPEAIATMREYQARYDAGESIRSVNGNVLP
jgi:enoyl-CoA hydratase/carnithine racemase